MQWNENVLDGILASKGKSKLHASIINIDDVEVEDDYDNNHHVAWWVLTYLGKEYKWEFVMAAQNLSMPIHKTRMPAEHAAAMWDDTGVGVGVSSQWVVMKNFHDFFGYWFMVKETELSKLSSGTIPPTTLTYEDNQKIKYDYWYKELDQVPATKIAYEHSNSQI